MRVDLLLTTGQITQREQRLLAAAKGYPLPMSLPDKLGALKAATTALSSAGVAHALIGGLAVGIRSGVPRATLDVDLAVSSKADRSATTQLLLGFGFSLVGEFEHSMNFRHESGEPVQLAFDPAFDAMIARADAMDLGEFVLPVVTRQDLIEMKRRAAADPARRRSMALRDQADIALLEGDVPGENEGW